MLARIRGASRPDEYVIYGVHWDANGRNGPGAAGDEIRNGAVDNATGTAELLDVAALYVESLNDLASLHASRVNVGLHARLPGGLWLALYALVAVSMLAVGYHTAIARSRRSWITMMLALSFSLVITLIAALDRPEGGYPPVSQQPLEDLRATMDAGLEAPPR